MKVALGFKAHSGWAAAVVIGAADDDLQIIDRRRIDLIEEGEIWAKQPYHAAEDLKPTEARQVVDSGIKSARHIAARRMREAVARIGKSKHEIIGCGVLVPEPMPRWTTEEILAVHFRMHKAEGVLFPEALCRAAEVCGLRLVTIPEKQLAEQAEKALDMPFTKISDKINALGKSVGPPWGKDQKTSTLAALIVLQGNVE